MQSRIVLHYIQYRVYGSDGKYELKSSEPFVSELYMKTQVQRIWKGIKQKHKASDPKFVGIIKVETVTTVEPVNFDFEIE